MGFVRSDEEIKATEAIIGAPRFVNAHMLSVEVESDDGYLRSILPPPLELARPTLRFMVGQWQSNCVGDYAGGAVYVPARFQSAAEVVKGDYVLTMFIDNELAVTFGREVLGEPKKCASSRLSSSAAAASGWVERNGVRLFELDAIWERDEASKMTTGRAFNFKAFPSCTGTGLDADPILVVAEATVTLRESRVGTGTVRVEGTAHDPLHELPLGDVVGATWHVGDRQITARPLATVDQRAFLPYYHGRNDDIGGRASRGVRSLL